MLFFKKLILASVILGAAFSGSVQAKSCLLSKPESDIEIDFWGYFKPEVFAGKNFTFLNNNMPQDTIFYFRHTNDYFLNLVYGKDTYGCPAAEFKTSVRNRAVWGSPSTVALTLPSHIRAGGLEFGDHNHAFPRLFFWMRELWLQLSLVELLNICTDCSHSLTVGAFPFELGRGISLGAAYAIGPGPLGFYSDSMIDQFAFGLKLSGDIIPDVLRYDVYGALLQSRSNSLLETNKPIYRNEIGRRNNPARGFGQDNYLIAARVIWTACDSDDWGLFTLEPYGMFNNDPEQRVEFTADSNSKLGTFGLAGEYVAGPFEFGFDGAFNIGRQWVRPWDRNYLIADNFNGQLVSVNSQVLVVNDNANPQFNGAKAPDVPKSPAQGAINNSGNTGCVTNNGQVIPGATGLPSLGYIPGPLDLRNSDIRFRTGPDCQGYKNTYKGWMLVADASYWVYKKDVQVAVTGGYASGDQDPNFTVIDGDYKGFIGLQEVYAGKRVKSVFLLGTVGKVRRPGTQPEFPLANKDFTSGNSGFTNLGFFGTGVTWKPSSCKETRVVVNPNVFAYWVPSAGNKFNPLTGKDIPNDPAGKFMGTEANIFLSYFPFSSLKCFAIGSVFIPGKYFKDHKGKPFNAEERRLLEAWQKSNGGNPNLKDLPNIGDDVAYTINFGLEFAF